ncbi:MAG: preprotein translocase subunit SecG [Planctomycetaceae bacterium]|nr:preprotein translocase subunit SecG [Planctomycetaceae bacterium]
MLLAQLFTHIVVGSLLFFTSLIMIFLILIQRGRGGGLAGALGGSGGSSAFGAKAGDTFTRVTAGMAIFWFVLCLFAILLIQGPRVAPPSEREPGVAGTGAGTSEVDETAPTEPSNKLPGLPELPAGAPGDSDDTTKSDGNSTPAATDPATTDPAATDPATTDSKATGPTTESVTPPPTTDATSGGTSGSAPSETGAAGTETKAGENNGAGDPPKTDNASR